MSSRYRQPERWSLNKNVQVDQIPAWSFSQFLLTPHNCKLTANPYLQMSGIIHQRAQSIQVISERLQAGHSSLPTELHQIQPVSDQAAERHNLPRPAAVPGRHLVDAQLTGGRGVRWTVRPGVI